MLLGRRCSQNEKAIAAAEAIAKISRIRAALCCQPSIAKRRHMARIAIGKAAAPVYCTERATEPAPCNWAMPEPRDAVLTRPPAVHNNPQTAKMMLAHCVPGSI